MRRLMLVGAALLVAFVVACEAGDDEMLANFLLTYLEQKNYVDISGEIGGENAGFYVDKATNAADKQALQDELTKNGVLSCASIIRHTNIGEPPDPPCKVGADYTGAAGNFLGGTRDDTAEAVAEAGEVVDNIRKGDELAEEGRKNNNLTPIAKAIELRPANAYYQVQEGYVYINQQNFDAARQSFADADKLAEAQGPRVKKDILGRRLFSAQAAYREPAVAAPIRAFWRTQGCLDIETYLALTGDQKTRNDVRKNLDCDESD